MTTSPRPGSVTLLATLVGLAAIPPLAFGIVSLIGSAATFLSTADSPALPVALLGVGYLALAIAYLAVAWGLFSLRPWAWLVTAAVALVHIVVNVASALGANIGGAQSIIGSILPVVIAIVLLRGDVRHAFGR